MLSEQAEVRGLSLPEYLTELAANEEAGGADEATDPKAIDGALERVNQELPSLPPLPSGFSRANLYR
jgi:hypothetical protein